MNDFTKMASFLDRHVQLKPVHTADEKNVVTLHSRLHALIIGAPDKLEFLGLSRECEKGGQYARVAPFDGKEHSFMELGGWLGDQRVALCYMAMTEHFGLAQLLTPRKVLGEDLPKEMEMQLFGMGMCTIVAQPTRDLTQNKKATDPNNSLKDGPV